MYLSIDLIGHQTIGLRPKGPGDWAAGAIVALHIDQGRTAGVKDADIGLQLPDKLERVVNQQGWIMAAW